MKLSPLLLAGSLAVNAALVPFASPSSPEGLAAAQAAAERTFREDTGNFLSAAEAKEFLLRGSVSASQLIQTLVPFHATEQEYRAIFPIYQAFQDQFPQQGDLLPAQAGARRLAQDQMNNQLKLALGPDRAAEFHQAIDSKSQQLNRPVARLGLPLSAAIQVNAVQSDMQTRGAALRTDASLSTEPRTVQSAALAQEASTKISAALGGPQGLEAYK